MVKNILDFERSQDCYGFTLIFVFTYFLDSKRTKQYNGFTIMFVLNLFYFYTFIQLIETIFQLKNLGKT